MDLFSRIAKNYDKIIRGFALDTIKDSLTLESDKLLLDLGGGTGRVSTELEKHANGIVLLDRSFEMLNRLVPVAENEMDLSKIVQEAYAASSRYPQWIYFF